MKTLSLMQAREHQKSRRWRPRLEGKEKPAGPVGALTECWILVITIILRGRLCQFQAREIREKFQCF